MKIIFVIFVCLHAFIHLLGFVKAFDFKEFRTLRVSISRPMGLLWLLASILFLIFAFLTLVEVKHAWIIGLISVILSQLLIFYSWNGAKLGSLANLVILIAVLYTYGKLDFYQMAHEDAKVILSKLTHKETPVLKKSEINQLPAPVKRWLKHVAVLGREKISLGRIEQQAFLKMEVDQEEWYKAEAVQYTTVENPAFIWVVDVEMNPLMKFKGRDQFVDGKGEVLIKLNLLNVVNESGEKLNEGSLQRFLGEMVWFPSMAVSPYISWQAVDDNSAIAKMEYMGSRGSGRFYFNEEGEFVKYTALRYMENEINAKRYEWILEVDEYTSFEGVKVPSKMRASWNLETGKWTWLKLEVTDIKYNENALKASNLLYLGE